METRILHQQIQSLIKSFPDFSTYASNARDYQPWIGKAAAILKQYSQSKATIFEATAMNLASEHFWIDSSNKMSQILHSAAQDLKLQLPAGGEQVFGPGAVYDFYKALSEVIGTAQSSLFVIDPYIDSQIFDQYLSSTPDSVSVRLLLSKASQDLNTALQRFNQQKHQSVEIRQTKEIHDRVIFIDKMSCWILGQSIKDAAEKKPTYLAPLASDLVAQKISIYEDVWTKAAPI